MNQYRSILKATSIFGGTQILQLLIQLIRTKFVAVLVGAVGMGLSSMYTSSLTIYITIFGMGINMSVIRDLCKANDEGDEERFSMVVGVFNKMLLILAICGTLFVVSFSSTISNLSFGTNEHTIDYCFLSLIVFFTLLTQGNTARMVGKRRIKDVALSSLWGALATLITSVPFFYFWGIKGVVPGLIVSTFSNYLISFIYARRIQLEPVTVSFNEIKEYGKSILSLGFTMVLATLLGNVSVYVINIFITRLGGIQDLGYFNAGMSITQQVVSLVFAAMAADYYPRLVSSLKDENIMNETINQQSEVLMYLSTPMLCAFSVFSTLIVQILLSEEFLIINSFVRILCFGMFLKVFSYAIGYISFAKGDKVVYLVLEGVVGNTINILFSVLFYGHWGLRGIAFGFVCNYFIYTLIVYLVGKKRYHYKISYDVFASLLINLSFMSTILVLNFLFDGYVYYVISILVLLIVGFYNIKQLNKKTSFLHSIKERL